MKRFTEGRPRKLSLEQVSDIQGYLRAHKWRGAVAAIAKKHRVSRATVDVVMRGVYFCKRKSLGGGRHVD